MWKILLLLHFENATQLDNKIIIIICFKLRLPARIFILCMECYGEFIVIAVFCWRSVLASC